MGGSEGTRGYLVQAMILILDTLQSSELWDEVSLEPNDESEKVDIKWLFPKHTKVVQVKSSINAFRKSEVENWCLELKSSASADSYELALVGVTTPPVIELVKTGFHDVKISFRNLDLDSMTKQIAHDLDVYCEQRSIPSRNPSARELLADALVAKLEKYSTEGKFVRRNEFEGLLSKWILLLLPQIDGFADISSTTIISPVYEPEAWWQTLPFEAGKSLQSLLLMDEVRRIAIVGKSGSGKTSTMRMAAYDLNQDPSRICFWIPLRSYTLDLVTTIKRFLGWFDLSNDKVIQALQRHNIILLLDGLNEVPKNHREQCASEIEQLFSAYQGKVCISYPISDKNLYVFEAEIHEMLPLDELVISKAVDAYYRDNESKRQFLLDMVERLKHEDKGRLFSFLKNPIYLGFFLELAESKDLVYKTFRDFYGEIAEKRLASIEQRGKQGQIHINQKVDLLKSLAFRSLLEERDLQMSKMFVRDVFVNLVKSDVDIALDEIIQSSLLVEVNESNVEWFHPSFRDYFAGRYLVNLVELDKSVKEFPFGEDRAISAIAHAVKISTQTLDLTRRYRLYLDFLKSNPEFDTIELVSAEYGFSKWIGDSETIDDAIKEFNQSKWGERFLYAYQLLLKSLFQENSTDKDKFPTSQGLTVFFSPQIDFCLILFSDLDEVRFAKLDMLESVVYDIIRENKPCVGFCLYAPFLFLLDPEILAYVEMEVLIKLLKPDIKDNVLRNLPELPVTHSSLISWGKLTDPPIYPYQANKLSKNVLLNWDDFYSPVTFVVDPRREKQNPRFPRSYLISLGLLMPFTPRNWHKIDLPNNVYISFPIHLLNGYYSSESISGGMSDNKIVQAFDQFVHLQKI